ncbi:MAG: hypothetical protein Q9161_008746 [Pseudevernia consocians]
MAAVVPKIVTTTGLTPHVLRATVNNPPPPINLWDQELSSDVSAFISALALALALAADNDSPTRPKVDILSGSKRAPNSRRRRQRTRRPMRHTLRGALGPPVPAPRCWSGLRVRRGGGVQFLVELIGRDAGARVHAFGPRGGRGDGGGAVGWVNEAVATERGLAPRGGGAGGEDRGVPGAGDRGGQSPGQCAQAERGGSARRRWVVLAAGADGGGTGSRGAVFGVVGRPGGGGI